MQDDLIGFLIGALDASEQKEIEQKLQTDVALQRKLKKAERLLAPLSWDRREWNPPAGLAERTCEYVANFVASKSTLETDDLNPRDVWQAAVDTATGDQLAEAQPHKKDESSERTLEPASKKRPRKLSSTNEIAAESGGWSFADFVVAAGICFAAACLFFPAILNSRYNAQLAQCQNNLRKLGHSLISYSEDNGGFFPVIPERGKLAFAGAYAAMLREKGLVAEDETEILSCPSKERRMIIFRIPRPEDVNRAQGPQLIALQQTMGGDYAYPLGYLENGKLRGIRNQNRPRFAILADSPIGSVGKHQGTHGKGQNVLFEHGNVGFLASRTRPDSRNDDIFLNDRGEVQAGVHAEDVVLAPSSTPPVVFVSH